MPNKGETNLQEESPDQEFSEHQVDPMPVKYKNEISKWEPGALLFFESS